MNTTISLARFIGMLRSMPPLERVAVVAAIMVLVYALIQLLAASSREKRERRLALLKARSVSAKQESRSIDLAAPRPRNWHEKLGAALADSPVVGPSDRRRLLELLEGAGFRDGRFRVATLITIKLCGALFLAGAAWCIVTFYTSYGGLFLPRFLATTAATLAGWRAPDLAVTWLARRRKAKIEAAFPDALDLLVISAEAGLSLDYGIDFAARVMTRMAPALSEEFGRMSAELRVLGDRATALHHFARRINLPSVRSVISTLTQTMRYGTPLAQSLRLLAAEMRTERLLRIEERAARLPVLLTLPLMMLILPSLVLVIAGPAILRVIDALGAFAK